MWQLLFGREIPLFPVISGATVIALEDFFQQEEDVTRSLPYVTANLQNYAVSTLKRNWFLRRGKFWEQNSKEHTLVKKQDLLHVLEETSI